MSTEPLDETVIVRKASARSEASTVRVSLPAEVVDNLGVTGGDQLAIIVTDDEVRIEPLRARFGLEQVHTFFTAFTLTSLLSSPLLQTPPKSTVTPIISV